MCNNKRYYHDRDFVYTGLGGLLEGVTAIPSNLAKLMAKQLGGKYKLIPTRGCSKLKNKLPLKHTTLGKVVKKYIRNSKFSNNFCYIKM